MGIGAMMIPAMGGGSLLPWNKGDFSNSLSGRTLWAAVDRVLHGPFAAGVAATAWIDGTNFYQSEFSATNDVDDSEDFTAASWTSLGAVIVVANAGPSPELSAPITADSLEFAAASGDGVSTPIAGVATNKKVTVTVFARTFNGAKGFRLQILRKDGTVATSAEMTATTTYDRFDFTADILSGGTTPEMRIINDAGATAGVALFWGAMADDGGGVGADRPSSYVATTGSPVTRPSDSMLFTAAQIPTVMREGKWKYNVLMQGTEGESTPPTGITIDFQFGTGGSTNGFAFRRFAAGRVQAIDVRVPTTYVQTPGSPAPTWSRQQVVGMQFDTVAGEVELSNMTTGDGLYSGTSWTGVIPASDDMSVGRQYSSSTAFTRGLLAEPEAVASS